MKKTLTLKLFNTLKKGICVMLVIVVMNQVLQSVMQLHSGISSLERHITIDRSMYGSDQSASIEPQGLFQLVEL